MAVPTTFDSSGWLVNHLESEGDGDLLREMIKTVAEALMSAQAQAMRCAGYGDANPNGRTVVTATGPASSTLGRARSSWRCPTAPRQLLPGLTVDSRAGGPSHGPSAVKDS